MAAFDALPSELRAWVRSAKLPWSAQSCQKIWHKARASGASPTEALARLDQVERATLARDQMAHDQLARDQLARETMPRSGRAGR